MEVVLFDFPMLSDVTQSLNQLNIEGAFVSGIAAVVGAHPSVASCANQQLNNMNRLNELLITVKRHTESTRHQVVLKSFDEIESHNQHEQLSDFESGFRMHVQSLRYFRDYQLSPDMALGEYKGLMLNAVDDLILSINKVLVDVVALNNHYRQFFISEDVNDKVAFTNVGFKSYTGQLRSVSTNAERLLREKNIHELSQFNE